MGKPDAYDGHFLSACGTYLLPRKETAVAALWDFQSPQLVSQVLILSHLSCGVGACLFVGQEINNKSVHRV